MINSVRKYEIGSDVESRLRKIHYTNGNEQLCIEVSKNIKGILDLIPVFNSKKKSTFTHRKLIGFFMSVDSSFHQCLLFRLFNMKVRKHLLKGW